MLYFSLILFSVFTHAAEPALKCSGVKANNADIQYDLTVATLNQNSVTVTNGVTKEKCDCKFRMSNFTDAAKGVAPHQSVSMAFQSCDNKCTAGLKKQISANIEVTYKQSTGESFATPFVGRQISKCEKFSINVHELRKIEADRISRLDVSPEVKKRLKDIKGLGARN